MEKELGEFELFPLGFFFCLIVMTLFLLSYPRMLLF